MARIDRFRRSTVSEAHVVRYWLARERGVTDDPAGIGDLPFAAALDELLVRKPGAAAFLWRERPIQWYRVELTRAEFTDLHHVGGPQDLLWRNLSPDGSVLGTARRLHRDDSILAETDRIDERRIRAFQRTLSRDGDLGALVVKTRRGYTPWFVVDGNHRAVAIALHLLESGEYDPIEAYLGVTANPVVGPFQQRLRGIIDRLRGRFPARRS